MEDSLAVASPPPRALLAAHRRRRHGASWLWVLWESVTTLAVLPAVQGCVYTLGLYLGRRLLVPRLRALAGR